MGFKAFKISFDFGIFDHIVSHESRQWLQTKPFEIEVHGLEQLVFAHAVKKASSGLLKASLGALAVTAIMYLPFSLPPSP